MYCCLMADCLATSSHSVWRCSTEVKPCKDSGELTRSRSVSITAKKSKVHVRNEREVGERRGREGRWGEKEGKGGGRACFEGRV